MNEQRIEAAAKAIEEALRTGNWALHAASASVGIERKMSTQEVVANWLACKAVAAAEAVGDSSDELEREREVSSQLRTALKTLVQHVNEFMDAPRAAGAMGMLDHDLDIARRVASYPLNEDAAK